MMLISYHFGGPFVLAGSKFTIYPNEGNTGVNGTSFRDGIISDDV